jgi:ribA/ribD-fused uncharacterized protein
MGTPAFRGRLNFCSNFYPCIVYDEMCVKYQCVENAYQAAKTLDINEREKISKMLPGEAKRYSKKIKIRDDWEQVKLFVMEFFLKQKFIKNSPNYVKLKKTGKEILMEENNWGDKFWGTVNGVGENHLGKILMRIRDNE